MDTSHYTYSCCCDITLILIKVEDYDSHPRNWNLNVLKRTFNGVESLVLKEGCNVVLLTNLDVESGLCNGAQVILASKSSL